MDIIVIISFWVSLVILFYIYLGYFLILKTISFFFSWSESSNQSTDYFPTTTIVISAFNEEKRIKKRIENLNFLDYPNNKIEIIVASDGSTDKTVALARGYPNIKVLDFENNRGRAAIQNDSVKEATGKIIIFTDAETTFERDFLRKICGYFVNKYVGCVVGNLIYKTIETSVSKSEGLYWIVEKKIRELESKIGILATSTGACMAVRRKLWQPLSTIDDCDYITPLDIVLQGYTVRYKPDAIAYDTPPSSVTGEFHARVRQTSRNLIGTIRRWRLRSCVKHPAVSWSILSHKILRWLTPFLMISLFSSNLFLFNSGQFYTVAFVGQVVFYLLAIAGLVCELIMIRIPVASNIFAFCIACLGIGIGVIRGITGKAPASYV